MTRQIRCTKYGVWKGDVKSKLNEPGLGGSRGRQKVGTWKAYGVAQTDEPRKSEE
jgi:hypothetical protein